MLGKGEESSNGREKESILAGTYEALIGALYIDRGLKKTTKLIEKHFQNQRNYQPGRYFPKTGFYHPFLYSKK